MPEVRQKRELCHKTSGQTQDAGGWALLLPSEGSGDCGSMPASPLGHSGCFPGETPSYWEFLDTLQWSTALELSPDVLGAALVRQSLPGQDHRVQVETSAKSRSCSHGFSLASLPVTMTLFALHDGRHHSSRSQNWKWRLLFRTFLFHVPEINKKKSKNIFNLLGQLKKKLALS